MTGNEFYDELVAQADLTGLAKPKTTQPVQNTDTSEWIILPGTNDYSDTLVHLKRDLQGKDWETTHKLLQQDGSYMLTIRQFADFLRLLKQDIVYFADGTLLSHARRNAVLDDILTVRVPYRAEWLDAKFEKEKKDLLINYNHRIQNGVLVPNNTEGLTNYLTKDRQINIESWLATTNRYGLPAPKTQDGNLYYLAPRDGYVARFMANADRAILGCMGYPVDTYAGLGVHRAKDRQPINEVKSKKYDVYEYPYIKKIYLEEDFKTSSKINKEVCLEENE